MTGTDKGFEPEANITRATIYEMFWKMEGSPVVPAPAEHLLQLNEAVSGISGSWWTNSARWAYREGLTTGDEGGRYAGDRVLTKAEAVTILYRYMKDYRGLDVTVEEGWTLDVFQDADKIQSWAREGMRWAWLSGVACQQDADPTLDPEGPVKRIELARMLTVMGADMEEQTRSWREDAAVAIEVAEQDGVPAHTVPGTLCAPKDTEGKKLPAVVMLHGTGSSRDEAGGGYALAAPRMAEAGIVTLRIDFMGSGTSEADYAEYSYTSACIDAKAAADYLAELDYVDPDKIAVLGWSQGGTDALLAAAAYPDTFYAVITWAGATSLDGLFGETTFDRAWEQARENGYYELAFDWRSPLHVGSRWFSDVYGTDVLEEVAGIQAPILAIHGEEDTTVPSETAGQIAAAAPNGRALYIPGADHTYNVFAEGGEGCPTILKTIDAGIGFLQETFGSRVTGAVTAVSKYGNVTTDIPAARFAGAGYTVGDILIITTGDALVDAPFGTGYSNVDTGKAIILTDTSAGVITAAINMGNFSKTYEAAVGTPIQFQMGEKEGYLAEYELRNIDSKRTNDRSD